MKILLTGASGFLGRNLAPRLIAGGNDVICVSKEKVEIKGASRSLALDLVDQKSSLRIAADHAPDVVVHLAGLANVGASWQRPDDYFRVNVLATEHLLDAFGGAQFLFASSAEVYGDVPEDEQPIAEDRLPAPGNPYALTKAAAERLVLAKGGTVMRFFGIVGPGQSPQFAIPSFVEQLSELSRSGGGRMKVGNLAARRDFTHLHDAIDALELLATRDLEHRIFNLGAGEVASMQEVLDRLIRLAGVEVRVEVDPKRLRPSDTPLLQSDSSRLRAQGWSPQRTLGDALREIWKERLSSVSGSF